MYDNINLDCRFKPYGLYAPQFFIATNKVDIEKVKCGCGPGNLGDYLVPNTLIFLNVIEACRIHDWMYRKGGTKKDKSMADIIFLINMVRLVNHESIWYLKYFRRIRAMRFYSAVNAVESKFFN